MMKHDVMEFKNITEHYLDPELVRTLKAGIHYYLGAQLLTMMMCMIVFLVMIIIFLKSSRN